MCISLLISSYFNIKTITASALDLKKSPLFLERNEKDRSGSKNVLYSELPIYYNKLPMRADGPVNKMTPAEFIHASLFKKRT
jgi:hypothetical protein